MITVVGLGRNTGDLTQNGLKAIKSAEKLFVRTLVSRAGKQIKKFNPQSMDDLYESAENFDALNDAIATRICEAEGKAERVVYCVDGDGLTDTSVLALHKLYPDLTFIAGVSDATPCAPSLPLQTYAANGLPFWPDTSVPLILRGLFDRVTASEVKLWLMRFYGEETEIFYCKRDGFSRIVLADLDRQTGYEYNSYAFLPAQAEFGKPRYGYNDLMRIMTRLCSPDGCPWDREQTHASIAKNAREEAQELCEAIELDDIDNIEEESGDVILQGVFHGFIAEKYGEFTPEDVINRLCNKLVFRHTHVFGADKALNASDALDFWKAAKRKEKEKK